MTHPMQRARERRAWSQSELARRAGVSRQMVGSIESGTHSPRVDAALALAFTLGSSVEGLFAAPPVLASVRSLDPERAPAGSPLAAAEVGARTVVARVAGAQAGGAQPWLGMPEAVASTDGVEWLPGADHNSALVAGCDPSLGLVSALLPRRSGQHVVVMHASSALSATWLDEGSAHAVVVHGPRDGLPRVTADVDRYAFASWRVGLASAPGSVVPGVEEVCDRNLPVVQREEGAATQVAFLEAVRASGAQGAPSGPIAFGHLDATARVRHGAVAAVTMEPAALAAGLAFAALQEHVVELWVARQFAAHPALRALVELLSDQALRQRLGALPGYDITRTGE